MSLAAMVLADRSERLVRFYDRWIGLVTFGAADRVRELVLGEIAPGERLLDAGCGTGTLAVAAARSGAQVVAFDRSSAMLSLARQKADASGVTVDWRQGDIAFPPIGDERFDIATATFALSELSRDMAALAVRRLARALRPGGRLVVADEGLLERPALRLLAAIPRFLLAIGSFFVLQQLAPARRHPWRSLLTEAGLEMDAERSYQSGALRVLVASRPPDLAGRKRPVVALTDVLPRGLRRALLLAAAWIDLPITIQPGVYRIGRPGPDGPVLLTGNFLASVEAVRSALAGLDAYLVVEDTDGWNVWCASDAGLFNAEKAAALFELYGLDGLVRRHEIIVPRLGGRIHSALAALTGWKVAVGPIEARDLPVFLSMGLNPEMRSLQRMYRLPERIRVAALTTIQLPLFLLPLRFIPASTRRPAWRLALLSSWLLPLANDVIPGRTGIVKGTLLGCIAALAGVGTKRVSPQAAVTMLATAPLVGWVYQSSSPVIFWKRLWR
ncbi:MAG TPA: methyltransferase domain-containing protein [Candidatus Micrarchaeaceae archaeon]|nr:methyltransferase domain-containing protein [Candidatus Micrarchaeaceae archaeon]